MIANHGIGRGGSLICFAGGGTGGHLYPALAVADALRAVEPAARFLFFGGSRRVDDHVLGQAHCTAVRQSLAPLSVRPWRWPRIIANFRGACAACRDRFRADRPDCVIGTGGMASVPALREALRAGIPTAILNPDAVPGRANRYLARRVDAVFAQWEVTAAHLPRANVVVTGCPARSGFVSADRAGGIAHFGLDDGRRTLLITGASQGARSINNAVLANCEFLADAKWQVLHLTGEHDYERVRQAYASTRVPAVVVAYTDHMPLALAASDLVVSRAGASTLAELTCVGRASILLPYPYHRDQHQLQNAMCLARSGAAVIVPDRIEAELNGPALLSALARLIGDDAGRLQAGSAAAAIGRPNAASVIAGHMLRAFSDASGGRFDSVKPLPAGAR